MGNENRESRAKPTDETHSIHCDCQTGLNIETSVDDRIDLTSFDS